MILKGISYIILVTAFLACKNPKSQRDIYEEAEKEIANTIPFEGKFIKCEKIDNWHYDFYIKNKNDSVCLFTTVARLTEYDTSSLKKEGNNIILKYEIHYNEKRKRNENVIRKFQFLHDE